MKHDEIIKMNTTAWPFYLDQMPPYAWVKNFLTPGNNLLISSSIGTGATFSPPAPMINSL